VNRPILPWKTSIKSVTDFLSDRLLDITGAGGTRNFAQRTIRFMDRIRDTYDFAALNTHHFPFEKIHEAFDVASHDKENAFKVMLTF
jgi:L-iditol 2-dehydrogenase